MRTLVMGDIHGSAKALKQCLERSGFDPRVDKLIQIGDVADGWSETSECVDILLSIQDEASEENTPVFIRGNHDVWVYDWFKYGHQPVLWTQQGGKATIHSYFYSTKILDDGHKDFWNKQHDWFIDDDNRLFIHGGWDYLIGFPEGARVPTNTGTIAKECHWNRSLLMQTVRASLTPDFENKLVFKELSRFKEVYIGHSALNGNSPGPMRWGNLWNVDTGCGWNGVLTIMNVDTKQYYQSDRSEELYPDEKGR